MVEKFKADINKVYFINQYTLVHILSGQGNIQVDFKSYNDWEDKAIYLSKGQYIKFLSDNFIVRFITFPNETLFKAKEARVLFKHLISLGYINFKECDDCKNFLSQTVFNSNLYSIIDISTVQWYWQNPFEANKDEYHIIFDTKDLIDREYSNKLTNEDITSLINAKGYDAQALVKDKIGLSIKSLLSDKKILESKKEIAFTDKSIKEISYNSGFNDPAYFNKVFKNKVGQNPVQFREDFDYANRDVFSQNIIELLQKYHSTEHSLGFYANKMNLSVKALSKKVKNKMQTSLGKLIRAELINTSKSMLLQDAYVKDVAFKLGFEEPNHFSRFFKHHTGESPSEYKK